MLSPTLYTCLEGWQPELVSAVLLSEDAEKEAVHAKQDAAPEEDGELLSTRIGDARNFQGEGDSSERQDAICKSSAMIRTGPTRFTHR